ncbi:aspartate/glutamate racemase family protein [soil metagenome]
MPKILLINPNSSEDTTRMMVRIARDAAAPDVEIVGVTAANVPSMLITLVELAASEPEVEAAWRRAPSDIDAIIVSAFGDPAVERLRALTSVPVTGICEASMIEAAGESRRFGVATVTPEYAGVIQAKAESLGLGKRYVGIRLTPGDPRSLAADAHALAEALGDAVRLNIEIDGAEAVIIGGGPLGQAAETLAPRFAVPVIGPIPAAVRRATALSQAARLPGSASTRR